MEEMEEPENIHVYPCFGREHIPYTYCWCEPKPCEDEPVVWVHNPEQ